MNKRKQLTVRDLLAERLAKRLQNSRVHWQVPADTGQAGPAKPACRSAAGISRMRPAKSVAGPFGDTSRALTGVGKPITVRDVLVKRLAALRQKLPVTSSTGGSSRTRC